MSDTGGFEICIRKQDNDYRARVIAVVGQAKQKFSNAHPGCKIGNAAMQKDFAAPIVQFEDLDFPPSYARLA